jgi:hypothetical protein
MVLIPADERNMVFNFPPALRKIVVVARQRPDAVDVIWKLDPSVDVEGRRLRTEWMASRNALRIGASQRMERRRHATRVKK